MMPIMLTVINELYPRMHSPLVPLHSSFPPASIAPTKISSNASFGRKEKKVPKRQKVPYSERVVRSMLYSGVPTNHDGIVNVLAPTTAPKVQVQLLYPGQAESVSVSGTYEASWDIRTDLQYEYVTFWLIFENADSFWIVARQSECGLHRSRYHLLLIISSFSSTDYGRHPTPYRWPQIVVDDS